MTPIELLTQDWHKIPRELRPEAIAIVRDRAVRLALQWSGNPDETTYAERALKGAPASAIAHWSEKPLAALRTDLRVCHFVDACLRSQASFHRRKAPPRSARKLIEWVKQTRAHLDRCRDLLIDLHCGTPPYNEAGPVEREALRKMVEASRRENERAEMLLLAMAFYPAQSLEKPAAPSEEPDELSLPPLPQLSSTELSPSVLGW
jgi:hypothetical protein